MENFFCVSFNVPHTMQNSRYQCFANGNVSLIQFCFQPKLREISFLLHCPTVKSSKQYIPTIPQPSPHTTQTRQEDDVCCFLSFFLSSSLLHPGEHVFVSFRSVKSPAPGRTCRAGISINFIGRRCQSSVIYEGVCLHFLLCFYFSFVPFEIKEGVAWKPSACSPTSDNSTAPLFLIRRLPSQPTDKTSCDWCAYR